MLDITLQRVAAAESSGGTSSNAIYAAIEGVLAERGLKGTLLDYGAGVGHLTRRLYGLQRFDRICATDIMPKPRDLPAAVEWIEQDLNILMPGRDGAFDVVVAAEVIEHLENPRFMVRELFRLLRPGGTVIVSTPNNESWRSLIALLFRGHYMAFSDSCYPAHITALLRKDFTRIFRETGFPDPQFYYSNEGGIPGRPVISWQQVSGGMLRGLRFSDNIIAVAIKPS